MLLAEGWSAGARPPDCPLRRHAAPHRRRRLLAGLWRPDACIGYCLLVLAGILALRVLVRVFRPAADWRSRRRPNRHPHKRAAPHTPDPHTSANRARMQAHRQLDAERARDRSANPCSPVSRTNRRSRFALPCARGREDLQTARTSASSACLGAHLGGLLGCGDTAGSLRSCPQVRAPSGRWRVRMSAVCLDPD